MARSSVEVQATLNGLQVVNPRTTRKNYTREFKLEVIRFFCESNLYQTSTKYLLNTKTLGRRVADESKIQKSAKASKRVKFSSKCQLPEIEQVLHDEYKKLRKKDLK